MNGIIFGEHHSYDDLDLILSSKSIEPPIVKTATIDIPGADGELDFTEYFGKPKYKNRKLTFNFTSIEPYSDHIAQYSNIKNALHGQKVHITLDVDPDFYYIGRLTVGTWKDDKNIGSVTITCDCEPWKYKVDETTVTKSITDSGTVVLSNLRRYVVPKISTDAAITVAWTGGSVSLSAGDDWIIPELILESGDTTVTITGTANVTFTYREASL